MKNVKSKRVGQSHLGLFNRQGLLDAKESLFPNLTNFPRKFKLIVIIPEVVFLGCHNALPQTRWFKTTEMDSYTTLEVKTMVSDGLVLSG